MMHLLNGTVTVERRREPCASCEAVAGVCTQHAIDPAKKELFLSEKDFHETFGMDKAAFTALPKWKQKSQKQRFQLW